MFSLKASLILVGLLSLRAQATLTTLNVANANIAPDGFTRSAVLAGGTFPGPVISGNKHWHGIFQHGTAWADGAAFVTQCPIASGNSFLYNFDVPDQAGTYWYHSHLAEQYCDGLRGVFVVYDPQDPFRDLYDVDDESTIITLADWYHIISTKERLLPIPFFDATLINGKGRYAGGPATDLAVINVKQGTRYRFRLVSISCDPNFVFSIDGHTLTVIEADGENVTPLVVDSIQIYAGQRYSFILNANQVINNYWIRANPNAGTIGFAGGVNSAVLRYAGAPVAYPTTSAGQSVRPLVETNLHPLTNPAAPGTPGRGKADVNINLDMSFNPLTFQYLMNGSPFVSPTVPVLLQILSGADAKSLLPSGSLYELPINKTIEISFGVGVLTTVAGAPHPFHLHGHTFSVVRSAGNSTYNYVNPVRRDVVNTGVLGDLATIRFATDNSGPWFLHCHIDWHLTRGLAVVMVEDLPGIPGANPVPADWNDLCPIYDSLSANDKGAIV